MLDERIFSTEESQMPNYLAFLKWFLTTFCRSMNCFMNEQNNQTDNNSVKLGYRQSSLPIIRHVSTSKGVDTVQPLPCDGQVYNRAGG